MAPVIVGGKLPRHPGRYRLAPLRARGGPLARPALEAAATAGAQLCACPSVNQLWRAQSLRLAPLRARGGPLAGPLARPTLLAGGRWGPWTTLTPVSAAQPEERKSNRQKEATGAGKRSTGTTESFKVYWYTTGGVGASWRRLSTETGWRWPGRVTRNAGATDRCPGHAPATETDGPRERTAR
jgi:hypothetical protein